MPSTSRFRSGTRVRTRRHFEWTGAAVDSLASVGAGSVTGFYVVLPSEAAALTQPTLTRSIGFVTIVQSGSIAARGAWGLITWDDVDDTDPGAGSPNPYTRPDMAWIAHGYWLLTGGSNTGTTGPAHLRPTFDIKAQRKLPEPRGVLFVFANSASSAGIALFSAGVRCLLKE